MLRSLIFIFIASMFAECQITFRDITTQAGIHFTHNNGAFGKKYLPETMGPGCAFIDYDNDGWPDILLTNGTNWPGHQGPPTTPNLYHTHHDGTHKSYCTPESYKGTSARLWHNLGNGKFEDATQKAHFFDNTSKSLGIAILDYNNDGWPDILLANDTQPNKLYLNKHDGTFEERGVSAGIAFSEDGVARAGMGVDAGDYDRSGHASIIITNFANQMLSLYHNE